MLAGQKGGLKGGRKGGLKTARELRLFDEPATPEQIAALAAQGIQLRAGATRRELGIAQQMANRGGSFEDQAGVHPLVSLEPFTPLHGNALLPNDQVGGWVGGLGGWVGDKVKRVLCVCRLAAFFRAPTKRHGSPMPVPRTPS